MAALPSREPAPRFRRVAVFGDEFGVAQVLDALDPSLVACAVAAEIRPASAGVVAGRARALGLPFLKQPRAASPGYAAFRDALGALQPDLIVCHSYSMILRQDVLALVEGNAVNVHPSLLPRNRGPNPIQWAIIKGERETGVSLHYMTEALDAGDLIAQLPVPILDSDTWLTLRERIGGRAAELLAEQLPLLVAGRAARRPQDAGLATVNPRLTPESPRIDFATMSDRNVFDLVRAQVAPLGGAYLETPAGRRFLREYLPLDAVAALRANAGAA